MTESTTQPGIDRHFRIAELAQMLGVSRGSIYNWLRGLNVVHFAQPGRRGVTLVPESTVARLLKKQLRVYR